jgi:hypothetical protein
MAVERRKRIPCGHDFADALDAAEKFHQDARALDNDLATTRGDERRVTNELNGVAVSLFRINEHALTVQWTAVPQGLGKWPPGNLPRFPAGFIKRPSTLEIATQQGEKRQAESCPSISRIEFQ